ncbi:MAG: hypothetical protein B6242_11880 [Anaerolineaceae bacterium 4572_78]|nr:MAG: hypothetical protein B6242_11880 [Anaerolineaceae bacterium 4572_78]
MSNFNGQILTIIFWTFSKHLDYRLNWTKKQFTIITTNLVTVSPPPLSPPLQGEGSRKPNPQPLPYKERGARKPLPQPLPCKGEGSRKPNPQPLPYEERGARKTPSPPLPLGEGIEMGASRNYTCEGHKVTFCTKT